MSCFRKIVGKREDITANNILFSDLKCLSNLQKLRALESNDFSRNLERLYNHTYF